MLAQQDENNKPKAALRSCLASQPIPAQRWREDAHDAHQDLGWKRQCFGRGAPPAPLLSARTSSQGGQGGSGAYQGLHHVWFVVSESFGSEENIGHVVAFDHLQDHGGGTEGATPATSVPGGTNTRVRREKVASEHLPAPSESPFLSPTLHLPEQRLLPELGDLNLLHGVAQQ